MGVPIPLESGSRGDREQLRKQLREEVGNLQAVFPTQVLAHTFAFKPERSKQYLLERMKYTLEDLEDQHADLRAIQGMSNGDIIDAAFEQFHQCGRNVLSYVGDTFYLHNVGVLTQYRNHIHHLWQWNGVKN